MSKNLVVVLSHGVWGSFVTQQKVTLKEFYNFTGKNIWTVWVPKLHFDLIHMSVNLND